MREGRAGKACQFYWPNAGKTARKLDWKLKWKAQPEKKSGEGEEGWQSGAINWNEIANCISSVKQRKRWKTTTTNNNNNNNMTLRLLIRIPLICLVRIEKLLHGKLKPAANEANCQACPPFSAPPSLPRHWHRHTPLVGLKLVITESNCKCRMT